MKKLCLSLFFMLLVSAPQLGVAITVNSSDDVKMSGDKNCTLRDAVQKALDISLGTTTSFPECKTGMGTDVITFTSGLGTIKIAKPNDPIFLSSNLRILGPATISGDKHSRIFQIGSKFTIRLERLTLTEGFGDGEGGAILITSGDGDFKIINCELKGNSATGGGGALSNGGAAVEIDKSILRGNTAGTSGGALKGGGPWTIRNTEVNGNHAKQGGGAIHCTAKDLLIEFSSFLANSTSGDDGTSGGGALMSDCTTTTIQWSLFESNIALGKVGGGALYMRFSASGPIKQSVFKLNSTGWDSQGGSGGAIYAEGSLTVDQSAFNQNYATKGFGGGGIFFKNSKSTVVNSAFTGNVSQFDSEMVLGEPPAQPADGAAISVKDNSQVKIVASSLIGNHGMNELFYIGPGALPSSGVVLQNTIIEGWLARRNCDGELSRIHSGEVDINGKVVGKTNLQAAGTKDENGLFLFGEPTCQDVTSGSSKSSTQNGSFGPALPVGSLEFEYPRPAPDGDAAGKGDPTICTGSLVNFVDLLDEIRPDVCALGALEP